MRPKWSNLVKFCWGRNVIKIVSYVTQGNRVFLFFSLLRIRFNKRYLYCIGTSYTSHMQYHPCVKKNKIVSSRHYWCRFLIPERSYSAETGKYFACLFRRKYFVNAVTFNAMRILFKILPRLTQSRLCLNMKIENNCFLLEPYKTIGKDLHLKAEYIPRKYKIVQRPTIDGDHSNAAISSQLLHWLQATDVRINQSAHRFNISIFAESRPNGLYLSRGLALPDSIIVILLCVK